MFLFHINITLMWKGITHHDIIIITYFCSSSAMKYFNVFQLIVLALLSPALLFCFQPQQAAVFSENTLKLYYHHYLHSIKQQRDKVSN